MHVDRMQDVDKAIHWTLEHLYREGGHDLLYFLHVVAERTFDVVGEQEVPWNWLRACCITPKCILLTICGRR